MEELLKKCADQFPEFVDWCAIAYRDDLSEDFIERHFKELEGRRIGKYTVLSEDFMHRHADELNWETLCACQMMSKSFIEEHLDKIYLWSLLKSQTNLPESLLRHSASSFAIKDAIRYQKLPESIIEEFVKSPEFSHWSCLSWCQYLSEAFIKQHIDMLNLEAIASTQKLSPAFRRKYKIDVKDNWLYKSTAFKKKAVIDAGLYECHDEYFFAYKETWANRLYRAGMEQCEVGGSLERKADHTDKEQAWGYLVECTKTTNKRDHVMRKVKVYYKDVARVLCNGTQVRVTKLQFME